MDFEFESYEVRRERENKDLLGHRHIIIPYLSYSVGIDPCRKESWFKRLLIFLGLRKRSIGKVRVFKKNKDGKFEYIK